MDAYPNYIMKLSDAHVGELRKQAAEYALSQAARRRRASLWTRAHRRFLQRRTTDRSRRPSTVSGCIDQG